MSGLYSRALEIYRQTVGLRLVGRGEEDLDIEDVSPEDRQKILRRIDEVIDRNRLKVQADTFSIKAKRSGLGLPVLINGAIVIVVIGAIVIFSLLFNRQEDVLAAGGGTILSAESKLIETMRRESQAQLQEKDREILTFQQQLQATLEEQMLLQARTEQTIRQRETELEEQFQRALEEERQRLLQQGLTASAVEERLQSFEAEKRSELEAEFDAFRRRTEQEAAEREAAIAGLVQEYERELESAQAERSDLERVMQERETELQRQFQEQTEALESERARTSAQLSRLQEQQRQEQLVQDQILGAYESVNESIAAGRYDLALEQLESIRSYLDQEPARSLAGIQRRRPVELFIVSSLEDLIRSRSAREQRDLGSLIEAGSRIEALDEGISQANGLLEQGDLQAARQRYLGALGQIPSARQGHERLAEIESRLQAQSLARSRSEERRQIEARLSQGGSLFQEGQYQESLERYREALILLLEDSAAAGRIVDQIGEISARLAPAAVAAAQPPQPPEQENSRLSEQLSSLQADNESLSAQLRAVQGERDSLSERLQRLEGEKAELTAQIERLREQQLLLQGDQTQVAAELNARVERLQQQIAGLNARAERLQEEKAQLSARSEQLAAQVASLQAEKQALSSEREQIRGERDSLAAERDRLARELELAREAEAQRQQLQARLDGLEARFERQRETAKLSGETSPETLAALLEAKLLTWRIISTDPIASEHPELYDTMDRYLETLMEQSVLDGRYAAVRDMITVVDALLDTSEAVVPGELWLRYSHTDREDLLKRLLDRLESLLD